MHLRAEVKAVTGADRFRERVRIVRRQVVWDMERIADGRKPAEEFGPAAHRAPASGSPAFKGGRVWTPGDDDRYVFVANDPAEGGFDRGSGFRWCERGPPAQQPAWQRFARA